METSDELLKRKEELTKQLLEKREAVSLKIANEKLRTEITELEKSLKEDTLTDIKKKSKGFIQGLNNVWNKVVEIADNMPDAETVINGTTHPKKKKTKKNKGVVRGKQ